MKDWFRSYQAKRLIWLMILCSFPLFLTACDGYLSTDGVVYEWMNAPPDAKGHVYVDEQVPAGRIMLPVSGATVQFSIYVPATTDLAGNFTWGGTCAP